MEAKEGEEDELEERKGGLRQTGRGVDRRERSGDLDERADMGGGGERGGMRAGRGGGEWKRGGGVDRRRRRRKDARGGEEEGE